MRNILGALCFLLFGIFLFWVIPNCDRTQTASLADSETVSSVSSAPSASPVSSVPSVSLNKSTEAAGAITVTAKDVLENVAQKADIPPVKEQETVQQTSVAKTVESTVVSAQKQVSPVEFTADTLISGASIVLEGVNFEYDSAKLTEDSLFVLHSIAKTLTYEDQITLEVAGYTDNKGDELYNRELSRKRAITVKTFLVDNGVTETRLTANGYGSDSPIGDNNTEEGRAENRRVEMHVR